MKIFIFSAILTSVTSLVFAQDTTEYTITISQEVVDIAGKKSRGRLY